jgi:hypothetical protein
MATPNITRLNGEYVAKRFVSTGRRPDGIQVINKSGSSIAADKVVAISGYDSTSKLVKIVLADPTATSHADIWVTKQAIANNKAGYVYKGHKSAATLDTSSFANVGDPVYLSNTVGGFSASPANPGASIQVGFVQVKSSTVGQITWDILPTAANINSTGSGILTVSGTITSANITGTSAGQLGHAQGVVLVSPGGTHIINQLVYAVLINAFNTAAYTGGGNTSINIGGGGAALTGVAAAASFITSGANKIIEFVPLAATFNTYTENNSLNLVSASAPTQPGTAAGVFRYIVGYRQIATGL